MARLIRIALDLTIVSLKSYVQPTLKNVWSVTKTAVANTAAKPLVTNRLVGGLENKIGGLNDNLISKLESIRDKQYKEELAYLEKEIEKVKQRISGRSKKSIGKVLRPSCAKSWAYSKTEVFPHFMQEWLHGSGGKALEGAVSKPVNSFFSGIEAKVREQDAAEARKIKAQEDAIRMIQEQQAKLKEDARLQEETTKKAEADKLKAEAEKKAAEEKKEAESKEKKK